MPDQRRHHPLVLDGRNEEEKKKSGHERTTQAGRRDRGVMCQPQLPDCVCHLGTVVVAEAAPCSSCRPCPGSALFVFLPRCLSACACPAPTPAEPETRAWLLSPRRVLLGHAEQQQTEVWEQLCVRACCVCICLPFAGRPPSLARVVCRSLLFVNGWGRVGRDGTSRVVFSREGARPSPAFLYMCSRWRCWWVCTL